jgi:signal peptidase I
MTTISPSRRKTSGWMHEVRPIALTLGLVLIAETALAQPFIVPSGSMEPTLLIGDEIAANKFAYGYSKFSSPVGLMPDFPGRILGHAPERGDIVVFRLPRDPSQTYVKRVIGLPGDRIQMIQGQLYINGKVVPRRPIGPASAEENGRPWSATKYVETLPNGRTHEILKVSDYAPLNTTPEFLVPQDNFFMMGDNRDNSLDSRVPAEKGGVGFVPAENLVGRAQLVLFSINPLGQWSQVLARPNEFRISRLFEPVK